MPGSVRLRDCRTLEEITKKQAEEKRLYAAICAAPAITLLPWGLLKRKKVYMHLILCFCLSEKILHVYVNGNIVMNVHFHSDNLSSGILAQASNFPSR